MIAALPIPVAHHVAVAFQRRSWGPAFSVLHDRGCVRVSRVKVRCRFWASAEGSTTVAGTPVQVTMPAHYDVTVKRRAKRIIAWESTDG